jgi:hypothetical protein
LVLEIKKKQFINIMEYWHCIERKTPIHEFSCFKLNKDNYMRAMNTQLSFCEGNCFPKEVYKRENEKIIKMDKIASVCDENAQYTRFLISVLFNAQGYRQCGGLMYKDILTKKLNTSSDNLFITLSPKLN